MFKKKWGGTFRFAFRLLRRKFNSPTMPVFINWNSLFLRLPASKHDAVNENCPPCYIKSSWNKTPPVDNNISPAPKFSRPESIFHLPILWVEIPDIGAQAGVSESTLRRLFKNELHCSPLDYLNSTRLKFAVGKLRHTGLRIKEIALMSGFLSSARFCTVFMEKYRMTPGEFRKRELEKKQN